MFCTIFGHLARAVSRAMEPSSEVQTSLAGSGRVAEGIFAVEQVQILSVGHLGKSVELGATPENKERLVIDSL